MYSGVGPQLMGLQAEEWTAQELRALRRAGWKLVSGLQLKGEADIDHILVGPGGLFVFEVKWSANPWPAFGPAQEFMCERQVDAVDQSRRNGRLVKLTFGRGLADDAIRAVCVLWDPRQLRAEPRMTDEVTLVAGPSLHQWLGTLNAPHLDRGDVDRIWSALTEHARKRDEWDAKEGKASHRTMGSVVLRSVLSPLVMAFAAVGVSGLAITLAGIPGISLPAGSVVAVSVTQMRRGFKHQELAWGWIAGASLFLFGAILAIVVRVFR